MERWCTCTYHIQIGKVMMLIEPLINNGTKLKPSVLCNVVTSAMVQSAQSHKDNKAAGVVTERFSCV